MTIGSDMCFNLRQFMHSSNSYLVTSASFQVILNSSLETFLFFILANVYQEAFYEHDFQRDPLIQTIRARISFCVAFSIAKNVACTQALITGLGKEEMSRYAKRAEGGGDWESTQTISPNAQGEPACRLRFWQLRIRLSWVGFGLFDRPDCRRVGSICNN